MSIAVNIGVGIAGLRKGGASPPPAENLGIQFSTGSSYLSKAITPNLSGSYSFMCWAKYLTGLASGVGNMLALWDGSGFDPGQCMQVYAGGGDEPANREVSVYISGGTPEGITIFQPLADDWFHICLSGPSAGGVWTLFINGIAAGTLIAPALSAGLDGIYAGSCFGGESFTGAVTNVKQGPVSVNAAEVIAEMASRSAIKAGLVAYSLNGEDDLSGFTLNGSATSTPGPGDLS